MLTSIIVKTDKLLKKLQHQNQYRRFVAAGNSLDCSGKMINVELAGECTHSTIFIGTGAVIENTRISIKGENHKLFIGDDVHLHGGILSMEGDANVIQINAKTTIEDAIIAATESNSKVIIGKDCMFSNKIEIRNGDSHSILKEGKRINQGGDVIIGNHVWVGCEAMILKNVTIGDNSIVAAKSLVSKSVASNVIVGGVPAKVINTEINWDRKLL